MQNASDNMNEASADFGESYFSSDSGSAYSNNYLETALLSRLYFEMADVISSCFHPNRVLEVGCGAGPVVHHLNNYFDIEAHGLDVSQWAVENRLHANVQLAPAHQLPFPDGHFDAVFSCHMLEHLTPDTIDASIAELSRVCTPGGLQFHWLPILGEGPYTDIFGSIVGLKKDPTHNLLHDRQWWAEKWERAGWQDTGLRAAMGYDNPGFEFSDCQFILSRSGLDSPTIAKIARWNLDVSRMYHQTLNRRPAPGLEIFLNEIKIHWPS